jgi:hypothetical protein
MSDPQTSREPAGVSHEDMLSALFAQLVMQQSNMAMMLMGKLAHPESGQVVKDLDAAKLFIDTLEMLETRTKGNLTPPEAALLKQSLMSLRLTFVETVESSPSPAEPGPAPAQPSAEPAQAAGPAAAEPASSPAADDEHRKKFTKKY